MPCEKAPCLFSSMADTLPQSKGFKFSEVMQSEIGQLKSH